MTDDPRAKPLAEAREDREKIVRAIQDLPTIAAKLRQDGLTLAAHGVDEALSIIRALSASPETNALANMTKQRDEAVAAADNLRSLFSPGKWLAPETEKKP